MLELNIWGVHTFKVRVTVDVEGWALVAKVGYFPLQGKALTEARKVMPEDGVRIPEAEEVQQSVVVVGAIARAAHLDAGAARIPDGETKEYRSDLKVKPGASLVVPERSFSRPEIVQVILGAAGILVSGMAVAIAARR